MYVCIYIYIYMYMYIYIYVEKSTSLKSRIVGNVRWNQQATAADAVIELTMARLGRLGVSNHIQPI